MQYVHLQPYWEWRHSHHTQKEELLSSPRVSVQCKLRRVHNTIDWNPILVSTLRQETWPLASYWEPAFTLVTSRLQYNNNVVKTIVTTTYVHWSANMKSMHLTCIFSVETSQNFVAWIQNGCTTSIKASCRICTGKNKNIKLSAWHLQLGKYKFKLECTTLTALSLGSITSLMTQLMRTLWSHKATSVLFWGGEQFIRSHNTNCIYIHTSNWMIS